MTGCGRAHDTHTGGVYASYSEWTEKETEIAKRRFSAEKPIVVIGSRGSGRISTFIGNDADLTVGRNAEGILSATRRFA